MNRPIFRASFLIISCLSANACSKSEESIQPVADDNSSSVLSSSVLMSQTNENLSDLIEMVVYKSPTCGCCQAWVSYVEDAGFAVNTIDTDDVDAIKHEHGLSDPGLKSCHTAIVDGYVIEGHVPVSDIERLLAERPAILGLTAPGMPMMSPGMASEIPRDYDVLAFDKSGRTSIYSSY